MMLATLLSHVSLAASSAASTSSAALASFALLGAMSPMIGTIVWLVALIVLVFIAGALSGKAPQWLRGSTYLLMVVAFFALCFYGGKLLAPLLPEHIWQNIIAFAILAILSYGLFKVFKHPFWGRRVRSIFRRPFVLISILLTVFFAGTALIDSISWIDNHDDDGSKQIALQAQQPRSILDRVFSAAVGVPEWEFREKSHSAPLADTQFQKDEVELKFKHLLGTTIDGRDTTYQVLKGCKPAVIVGTLPLIISIPLALLLGVMGGYFGGKIDDFVVYLYSTLASIPSLLLLFAIIMALGNGIFQVCIGLGVAGWVGLCRLSRGETLKLRELEYVQAAKCLGTSNAKIIMRHIIPNLMHIVIITAILAFTGLVLSEAVLSYLGIGLDNSWGGLINNSRNEIARQPAIWWNLVFASTALFLLVLAVNVIGDALRDALDPRISVGD